MRIATRHDISVSQNLNNDVVDVYDEVDARIEDMIQLEDEMDADEMDEDDDASISYIEY